MDAATEILLAAAGTVITILILLALAWWTNRIAERDFAVRQRYLDARIDAGIERVLTRAFAPDDDDPDRDDNL